MRARTIGRLFLLGALLGAVAGFAWYYVHRDRFDLRVIREPVVLPPGYEGLKGLKVVLFSDLHMIDAANDLTNFRTIIRRINAEKADLVFFAGDLFASDNFEKALPPARVIMRMRELKARYGVYAVTGNHDWYGGRGRGAALVRTLGLVGITVLDNRSVTVPGVCNLVGVQDAAGPVGPRPDLAMASVDPSLPTLALVHRPEYWKLFPAGVGLFFAGHTHGGQIRLPPVPNALLWVNGELDYPDHVFRGPEGRQLFVTSGIGTSWIRIRVNCPPEIMILEFGKANE